MAGPIPGGSVQTLGGLAPRPSEWSPAGLREDEGLGLQGRTVTLGPSPLCFPSPPHPCNPAPSPKNISRGLFFSVVLRFLRSDWL